MPRRRTYMILVAAAFAAVVAVTMGCPAACTCKWKGGKQTVECVNKSLLTIPAGMDTGTQVLDMSGNPLDGLSRGRFMTAGLSNLQKIFMSRCRITYVDDAAFRGLSNLVELDLSDNGIAEVPTKSFDDYPQLMKLVLSGNTVTAVRTAAFKRLVYLTVLDLSRCRLSSVEPGAFDGLQSLEWLRLDHNQIVRIEGTVVGAAVLPLSLHGIEMHHNPWVCDCRLRDVHRWLNNNSAPHTVEPTCQEPNRLRGSSVRRLAAEELACAPEADAASPTYVETDAGKNVTLTCRVKPEGEAHVSWWFEGRPVANSTAVVRGLLLSIEDVGPADNGTYACIAENRAGRAVCNFTVRVVQEPSEMAAGSYPPDAPGPALLVIALTGGSACLVGLAIMCAASCWLMLTKRRRRRAVGGKPNGVAGCASGDDSSNGQAAKSSSDVRQSDSVNLTVSSTLDCKLSSAEDISVYGEYDPSAAGSGSAAAYEMHEVLHAGSGGGYDPYCTHDMTATTLEANPDLISDASTVVRDAGSDYHQVAAGEVYKIAVPPALPGGREFWPGGAPIAIYSPVGGEACPSSYELRLSPRKLAAGEPYPPDYGLPKHQPPAGHAAMGYPPDYGLPKLQLYPRPPVAPQSYRTLPHRRNAAKPPGRSCQEAEFVLLQQHHHQPHHHQNPHHHQHQHQRASLYEPQNVRYNQQGYPYPAAAVADAAYYTTNAAAFYEPPPSLSNASAQTLDEETMMAMMMQSAATTAVPPPAVGKQQQLLPATEQQQQQHKAVTSVQKQSANTESPDEGYVGEGPDS